MNTNEKSKIMSLCKKYLHVFFNPNEKCCTCSVTTHKIRPRSEESIYLENFQYPYHLKKEMQIVSEIIWPLIAPYSNPGMCIASDVHSPEPKKS